MDHIWIIVHVARSTLLFSSPRSWWWRGDDLVCLPIKPVETAACLWQAEVVGFHSWAMVGEDSLAGFKSIPRAVLTN